jgi:hypothetical protein
MSCRRSSTPSENGSVLASIVPPLCRGASSSRSKRTFCANSAALGSSPPGKVRAWLWRPGQRVCDPRSLGTRKTGWRPIGNRQSRRMAIASSKSIAGAFGSAGRGASRVRSGAIGDSQDTGQSFQAERRSSATSRLATARDGCPPRRRSRPAPPSQPQACDPRLTQRARTAIPLSVSVESSTIQIATPR